MTFIFEKYNCIYTFKQLKGLFIIGLPGHNITDGTRPRNRRALGPAQVMYTQQKGFKQHPLLQIGMAKYINKLK